MHLSTEAYAAARESCLRNRHVGKILELAARFFITVGTGGLGVNSFRSGRDAFVLQIQSTVKRAMADALAAVEADPLDPGLSEARQERSLDPGVPLHPPPATRAERRRLINKMGVERLEQTGSSPTRKTANFYSTSTRNH